MFETPILLLVYNRLEPLQSVINILRKIQAKNLFIVADGPDSHKKNDKQRCDILREYLTESIDWNCNVHTLFRNENLGCGQGVSQGINWFFQQVEFGIILEDDTVPNVSFFSYCETLLKRYLHDESIMHIIGNDFSNYKRLKSNYYFSQLPFIWGWATWRRAWSKYNYEFKYLPKEEIIQILDETFLDESINKFWKNVLNQHYLTHNSYTWDYQWFVTIWLNKGLVIQPSRNLVKNIGFGIEATHTTNHNSKLSQLKTFDLKLNETKASIEVNSNKQIENFKFFFQNETLSFFQRKRILFKELVKNKLYRYFKSTFFNSVILHSHISKNSKLGPKSFFDNVSIGDYTYISECANVSKTIIGKFCSIGPNFYCGRGIHPIDGISTNPMFYSTQRQNGISFVRNDKIIERKEIIIGNDVFIGTNVTILDGVSIGHGAVIAAGAVVVRDVKPYEIVGGVPAKHIKFRFDNDKINEFLRMQWWDWPVEKLNLIEKYFFNVDDFLKICK